MPTHKPLVDTRRKSPELRHAARSSGGGGQRSVPAAAALAGRKDVNRVLPPPAARQQAAAASGGGGHMANKGGRIRDRPVMDRRRPAIFPAPASLNKAVPPRATGCRQGSG